MSLVAHNVDDKRTEDVQIQKNIDFSAMLLSNKILSGLKNCGFKKPSPIQLKAIPMGRCGFDLIVKAKSGTGKTAVFAITALEMVDTEQNHVQALILAPTREIAVQIQHVVKNIGSHLPGLTVEYFIGGTPLQDDEVKLKRCHIAVGAPGRIKHLIDKTLLDVSHIKLFVLDEADKLLENSYQTDINKIFHRLPIRKQVIAASATYPNNLDEFLSTYMTSPMHVSPDAKVPCLLGLKQFYVPVHHCPSVVLQMKIKTEQLTKVLTGLSFNQCLIFSNFQSRAESLSNLLKQEGWPCLYISGSQDQKTRLQVFDSLRDFKCRILSSTDLTARGIDAANVDLVVNYDVPHDVESYLHRMGRAGRYGSYGICITIVSEGQEMENLEKIVGSLGTVAVGRLPEKLTSTIWECDVEKLPQLLTPGKENHKEVDNNEQNETDGANQDDINEELFNKAVSQLTDLLRLNQYDRNGFDKVATVLKSLEIQNSLGQTAFFEQFKHMTPTEMITNLTNGCIQEKTREVRQENKRIKLDERCESPRLLQKNLALFTITKCLSDQKETKEDCLRCINELLELIRMEDKIERCNVNEFKRLSKENGLKTGDETFRNVLIESDQVASQGNETVSFDNSCKDFQCIENQVLCAYNYALSCGNTPYWDTVCDTHKIGMEVTVREKNVPENLMESQPESYNIEESYDMEESYGVDDGYENEDYEEQSYDEDPNTGIGEWEDVGVTESHIDEDLVSDAYKQALQAEFRRVSQVPTDDDHQPFGFATDTSYIPTKTNRTAPIETHTAIDSDLNDFVTRRNRYKQYFKHHGTVLRETASTFASVEEFQNWYHTWLQSLETLRQFVQQDVYEKEFKRNK